MNDEHQTALCRFFWALGWQFNIPVRACSWNRVTRVAARGTAWYDQW